MSSQAPRGRQSGGTGRSGGGRALMLFGVLLAILSGVLVIFIVSQATSNAGASIELVVANQGIPAGTALGAANIITDFTIEKYPSNLVPAGAYVFTTEDALKVHLNTYVVVQSLVAGDVLLNQDPRVVAAGTLVKGSLANTNPALIPTGSILYAFNYSFPSTATLSFFNAGDKVDVIVEECSAPFTTSSGGCVVQTTLQGIPVFAVFSSQVILVMDPTQAKQLTLLATTGTVHLALRKPGDTSTDNTSVITPASLAHDFHFQETPTP